MLFRFLVDLVLIFATASYCSRLSVASSKELVLESFNRKCCSNTQSGVTDTRRLKESGAIEGTTVALLKSIGTSLSKPETAQVQHKDIEIAAYELFHHRDFNQWIKNVEELKVKNAGDSTSVIPTMTAHLRDDVLYKILDYATHIQEFRSLAKKLQTEQVKHWLEIKKDPEEVFIVFGLEKMGANMFENPKFLDWVKYVEEFNKINPNRHKSMVSMIENHHDVADFIKQIEQAKRIDNKVIKRLANTLESDLITHFIRTKSLSSALDLLPVDSLSEKLLKDFCGTLLCGYMNEFPGTESLLISTFVTKFDDKFVALTIHTIKLQRGKTEMAKKLESALREHWMINEQSITVVYDLLELSSSEDDMFHSQLLETWISYLDYFLKTYPSETESLLVYLKNRFSTKPLSQIFSIAMKYPKMRRAIEIELLFERMKLSPDEMFVEIGLPESEDSVLSNPWFPRWIVYLEMYSRANPNYKTSLPTLLYVHFGSDSIERLNNELYVWCITRKLHPRFFGRLLGLNQASRRTSQYDALAQQYKKEYKRLVEDTESLK